MRALLGIVLSVWVAFGATSKNPPNCSTRPCVYTITCAAATCTSAEVAEVQAAINDSHLGDTIRLEAGRRFPAPSGGLQVTRRPGSSGVLTITTTGSLPPPGVRITPHWRAQLPTITVGGSPVVFQIPSGSNPPEHIVVRGIRFTGCGQGLIRIGAGSASNDNEVPDDITLEQILIENENWSTNCGSFVQARTRRFWYRDSWAAGTMTAGGERQSFATTDGPGPRQIENNYLADNNGENIMFGGTGPGYRNLGLTGIVRFNALVNHEERLRYSRWKSGMVVFRGRIISPSSAGSPTFEAQNSGITGNSEPSWPSTVGATVNDNGITWKMISTGTLHLTQKNNFEIKNGLGVYVYGNYLSGMWPDAQYENVVYKHANCPSGSGTGCQCVPYITGLANTAGTVVTSADGNPLPGFTSTPTNTITINGTQYTVADWDIYNPYRIVLSSSAGNQSNVPYSFGSANCRPAWHKDTTFEHNVVDGGPLAFQIAQMASSAWIAQIGNITVRNNLFIDIDPKKWSGNGGYVYNAKWYLWLSSVPWGTRIENNTLEGRNAQNSGVLFEAPSVSYRFTFRRNIWPIAAGTAFQAMSPPGGSAQSGLTSHLCDGQPCTPAEWDGNVMAGQDLTKFNVGTHWNLCSAQTGCTPPADWVDPVHGPLFLDVANGVWRVRETHPAKDSGARWELLSLIVSPSGKRGPEIRTTDTAAVFRYRTLNLNASIPCSVEISTTRDMDSLVAVTPDTTTDAYDGVPAGQLPSDRTIVLRGLSPGTTYWYRLHCGAIHEGSFQTATAAPSGSRTITLSFRAPAGGQWRLEWGTSYSRASNTLSGGGSGSAVACSAGGLCTVSAIAPSGIVFFRAVGPVALPVATSL
jgi:hypothetical protein